jgi:HAD superfamily phosphatase
MVFGCETKSVDGIILDVDGVLVDTRFSYGAAIKKTVNHVVTIMGNAPPTHTVSDRIILSMRRTGGFNNDTDTSYTLILVSLLSQITNTKKLERLLSDIIGNIDAGGIISVEKYLSTIFPRLSIKKIKRQLGYPGPVGKSIVATVFDEVFYGAELFRQRHGIHPQYYFGKALIDSDKILITEDTAKFLSKRFRNKIGIVSGRSKMAFEYSLPEMLSTFNKQACVFLEDESRKYAKPNPYGIKKAMKLMHAKSAVYVGDSVEDLIMARKARDEIGLEVEFLGIYGTSTKPIQTMNLLKKKGAKNVLRSINQMPNILNNVM